jgi:hypothetical protein
VAELRRGREHYLGDERILGSPAFVEDLQGEMERSTHARPPRLPLDRLVAYVCGEVGVPPTALSGGSRRASLSRAREGIAYLWTEVLGHPGRQLASALGIRPQSLYEAAARGKERAREWNRLLRRIT